MAVKKIENGLIVSNCSTEMKMYVVAGEQRNLVIEIVENGKVSVDMLVKDFGDVKEIIGFLNKTVAEMCKEVEKCQ